VRQMDDITEESWDARISPGTASQLNQKNLEHLEVREGRKHLPCGKIAGLVPIAEAEPSIDPWLVLRTRSRHESTVASNLKQKRINAFLPKHDVVRNRKDGDAVLTVPMFPGYVFVQPRAEQYEDLRYIPGSCGLVLAGNKPAAMPERDLEAVKILIRSGAELVVNPRLIPGQIVQVISGPFTGIRGHLIRVKSCEHLVINAHLLNSSVSVELDSEEVRIL
jgi:transcription antitermination factor NusG